MGILPRFWQGQTNIWGRYHFHHRLKQFSGFLECLDDNFLLEVIEKPTRRGALLDLILTTKEGLLGMWRSKAALNAATMRWWNSGPWWQAEGWKASSQPWTSGDQTLASSGICLEQSHGIRTVMEMGSKKTG